MLLAVYRLAVFLAAILVAGVSARSLWVAHNSYGGLWRQPALGEAQGVLVGANGGSDQFETTRADSVDTIVSWSTDVETGVRAPAPQFSIIPIFVQEKGEALSAIGGYRGAFVALPNSSRARRLPNGMPARPCPVAYASNILVHYHDANETAPVFNDDKIAIVQYTMPYEAEPIDTYLLISYVRSDSDNDGLLTCNDAGSLAVFDVAARKLTPIDLEGGEPIWDARPTREMIVTIGVGVDENGDGLHDRTRERVRIAAFNPDTKALDYLTP